MAGQSSYAQLNFLAITSPDDVSSGKVALLAKSDGLYAKLPGVSENLLLVVKSTPQEGLIAFFDDSKAVITSTSFVYDPDNFVCAMGAFNNDKDTVLRISCQSYHSSQANILDIHRSDDNDALTSGFELFNVVVNGRVSASAGAEVGKINFTAAENFSSSNKGTQYSLSTHTTGSSGNLAVRHMISGTGLTRIAGGILAGSISSDPVSMLESAGSVGATLTATSNNLSLSEAHFSVIVKGAHTITLPSASACTGRIYIIANKHSSAITISSYYNLLDSSSTSIAERTSIIIQSDGSAWHQIN